MGRSGRMFESCHTDHFLERKDMTCRGYDPKTVKIHKYVKRLAATILDNHQRGAFIRDYVRIAAGEQRGGKRPKE